MSYQEQEFNSGINFAWRVVNMERKQQEAIAAKAAKKNDIESVEEASYAASILERVAESIQSLKRSKNGKAANS